MKKVLALVAVAAALSVSATSLHADLLGSKVTGSLTFSDDTTNYFDPANGFVPSGFGNHSSASQLTINSGVEFGFDDGSNRDTANFTKNGLTVKDLCLDGFHCLGNSSFNMTFTDPAFASVSLLTNELGVTFAFSGDTLTIHYPGEGIADEDANATFSIGTAAQTPEPGTMALVTTGILGMTGAIRRRFIA